MHACSRFFNWSTIFDIVCGQAAASNTTPLWPLRLLTIIVFHSLLPCTFVAGFSTGVHHVISVMSMGFLTGKTLKWVLRAYIVHWWPWDRGEYGCWASLERSRHAFWWVVIRFAHNEYHVNVLDWGMLVSIFSRGGQGKAFASSLLGKYGFGGEQGLTCASSLNR